MARLEQYGRRAFPTPMDYDLTTWPAIDVGALTSVLGEVELAEYPELAGLSRTEIHEGQQGQGGLFFSADMAKRLALRPGMRVLDLACGVGTTALFLAKRHGVHVWAVDGIEPAGLRDRAAAAGVGELVTPVAADARKLPFAEGFFDAVFCMNSLFYFGTDDLYPPYLADFLKPGGEVVVGSPCYRTELKGDEPEEFLMEFPACLAVHSPDWWHNHFAKNRRFVVDHSALHPRGALFWQDRVRFLLEEKPLAEMSPGRQGMIYDILRMLQRDPDGFVSHFVLHARKVR